jgi:antitoxin (DNA-binding transcriptional repressor) of toxin-antitoxin stability system
MDQFAILADFDGVLDRVERGETIPIERNGRVTARFVPDSSEDDEIEVRRVD